MIDHETSHRSIEFPKDEGAHRGVKHEWWYLNGHVNDKHGHAFGFIVCFFNSGKLYIGIVDEDDNEFYSKTIHGNLKSARDKLDLSIGDNWWIETDEFIYEIHIEHEEACLDLRMTAERPPLLVGGHGLVPLGRAGTSYYYSQTRLGVDGRLMLLGEEREISGIGWIDRQWGNWDFNCLGGWEWFAIQLDNGSDIQLSKVFDPHTGASTTPMLNIMHADGTQETLDSYELEYLDYWTHLETGDKFSHGWRVKIPKKDTELVVTPTVEAQLLSRGLWEGSCKVTGRVGKEPVKGRAYVELLLKSNETKIIRVAKELFLLSRVSEWWSKVQTVSAAALVLLVSHPVAADFRWLPVLAVYVAFLGSYGYAINSYSDKQQDRRTGRPQKLGCFSDHQALLATCFFAFGAITIPLFFSDILIVILGLVTFLLTTFYSVRPLRFKERGILGIVVPALVQRPLPLLFFALLLGSNSVLTWYLLGWLTMVGLTMMFDHQLGDFRNDSEAQVDTWARRVGLSLARRTAIFSLLLALAYLALSPIIFGIDDGLAITVILFVLTGELRTSIGRMLRVRASMQKEISME